ncbi:MAG TPA: competence/damage-inducible protein A [Euzebyales bacterium]
MPPPDASGRDLRAWLVAVGSELVVGDVVDTNSAWLAQRLTELGIDVRRVVDVGDDLDDMVPVLRAAIADSDVVVVTGGLGPTADDVTRYAIADVAGVELERRAELAAGLEAYFAERGRSMPPVNLVQADLPVGADVLPPVGTAPGFAVHIDRTLVLCLPGVPSEMRRMTQDAVLPLLRERGGLAVTLRRTVRTAGITESEVAQRCAGLVERLADGDTPQIAFLASGGQVRVQVAARAPDAAAAHARVDPVVDEIVALLGRAVVGLDDEDVEHAVARLLNDRGWTLAVAESVTAGGIGARLAVVPGASTWFAGGVITYATAAKGRLADVPEDVLGTHGPVSEPTARAMADGIRRRLGTDAAVAVVGVAGPTTQGDRPVGTVCLAVTMPGLDDSRTVELPPRSRAEVQHFAVAAALEFLRRRLVRAAAP